MDHRFPVAFHPSYALTLPANHRFPMEKYELLPQQLILEGTCNSNDFFIPQPVDISIASRVHDTEYLNQLVQLNLSQKEIRSIGFPLSKALIDREFLIAGGTLMGAEMALKSGIAFNIAGGTHHAFRSRGEAFCLLNDQAIAAQYLLDQKKVKKILVLDLDVHQGNGTAEIFKDHPQVHTCSVHGAKNYPFQKEKSNTDIALNDNTNDAEYLKIIIELLKELNLVVQPDFIFYLSGVDVLSTDKLGRLALSIQGCKRRDALVFEHCHKYGIPVQCSMGGGYSKDIKTIVEAHSNTYREAKRIFI